LLEKKKSLKQEQVKFKVWRSREILIRVRINEPENRSEIEKIHKIKAVLKK
jgi:hypothetical protein